MEMTSLKFEDPLDGASNFLAWKARVILPQKQNDFWEIMDKGIQSPTDPTQYAAHEEEDIIDLCFIMDVVKDHLIPHLEKKKDKQGDVQTFTGFVPKQQHEHEDYLKKQAQIHLEVKI